MKINILSIFIFLLGINLSAQFYSSGVDPNSVEWKQIKTDNFKIIFPQQYETKAQYAAQCLEEVYKYVGKSMNYVPKKINVVIHSETAYSNGFCTLAPARVEFFSNPNQGIYSQEWIQQLSVHELRHAVQLGKLRNGFTRFLYYIFGQQIQGAVAGIYLPLWLLEGDAVTTETALTKTGRGRSPWFTQGMRAQILTKGIYSYDKAVFGSYKAYTPNHYEMGYLLTAGARIKYGSDIWESAINNSGRNSFFLGAFNKGQKKYSNKNKVELYKEIFNDLSEKWKHQDEQYIKTKYKVISKNKELYQNFNFPIPVNQENTIALLTQPSDIPRFVLLNSNGKYKEIYTPGDIQLQPFSYKNNIICWSEHVQDVRWGNKYYSVIKTFNIKTKKLSVIGKKEVFTAPALSSDAKKIAAVQSLNNNYYLTIISGENKEIIGKYNFKNNYLFSPNWNKDNSKIVCIALGQGGKQIVCFDTKNKVWKTLTQPTVQDIRFVNWTNDDNIVFNAGYSGTEEIYLLKNDSVYQLTQSTFGSRAAQQKKNGNFVYNNYTANGFEVVEASPKSFLYTKLTEVENFSPKLYEKISVQEKQKPDFSKVKTDTLLYKSKKYRKINNLFNFHSWAPAFVDYESRKITPGITLLSQNLLSNSIIQLGYNSDPQNKLKRYYANFKYSGMYPVFDFKFNYGYDNYPEQVKVEAFDFKTKVLLPLNLTHNKFNNYLEPSFTYNYIPVKYYKNGYYVSKLENNILEYKLLYYYLRKRAKREIAPKLGYRVSFDYAHTINSDISLGNRLGMMAKLYFPGLFNFHSVLIQSEFQNKNKGDFNSTTKEIMYIENLYNLPRGYKDMFVTTMLTFRLNYQFPVINPDFNIGGLTYLKRIRLNLFHDRSNIYINESKLNISSTGFEITAETHMLRFLFQTNLFYRFSYLDYLQKTRGEFGLHFNIK